MVGSRGYKDMDTVDSCRSHTLISTLLRLAGSMVGKARRLGPDEWGRAN